MKRKIVLVAIIFLALATKANAQTARETIDWIMKKVNNYG